MSVSYSTLKIFYFFSITEYTVEINIYHLRIMPLSHLKALYSLHLRIDKINFFDSIDGLVIVNVLLSATKAAKNG